MSESLFPPSAAAGQPAPAAQHDPLGSRRRRWPRVVLLVAVVIVVTIVVAAGISALRPTESCGCTGPTRPSPSLTGAEFYAVPPTVPRVVVRA